MPNEPGVNTVSPPADQDPLTSGSPVSSPVNADVLSPNPDDRPEKNLKAEFDRKHDKLVERMDELVALVTTRLTPTPATPERSGGKTYTDEELHQLWQQGYQEAGDMLIERKMERRLASEKAESQKDSIVNNQLMILFRKYPMLADPAHTLTKVALVAKRALIANGRPDNRQTELDAILLAIADNPSLAATPAEEPEYITPASVPGVMPRRAAPVKPKEPTMDPRSLAAAQRMGVKDPAGSRKRFYERNAKGSSSVSPLVAQILEEA